MDALQTIEKAGELIEFANKEIERLEAERDTLRAELAAAQERIKALETVEWVWHADDHHYQGGVYSCPWCDRERGEGHAPDCVRKT